MEGGQKQGKDKWSKTGQGHMGALGPRRTPISPAAADELPGAVERACPAPGSRRLLVERADVRPRYYSNRICVGTVKSRTPAFNWKPTKLMCERNRQPRPGAAEWIRRL